MNAIVAAPDKVWAPHLAGTIREMVELRLKEHRPRFRGVTVSVELATGRSFSVTMQGQEGVFNEESRSILRNFFTTEFPDRVKPLLEEYLGWRTVRVHTCPRQRTTHSWVWQIASLDMELDGGGHRHRRHASRSPAALP